MEKTQDANKYPRPYLSKGVITRDSFGYPELTRFYAEEAQTGYVFFEWLQTNSSSGIKFLKPVISKDVLTPPASPVVGDRYWIGGVGTGTWLTKDYQIAEWLNEIGVVAFTGAGLNDAVSGGAFTGAATLNYVVEIDNKEGSITVFADSTVATGVDTTVTSVAHGLVNGDIVLIAGTTSYNGTWTIENVTTDTFDIVTAFVADDATGAWEISPNTFSWSEDGGSTWTATGVAITGAAQTLSNGVTITFAATTGHTLGDKWSFTATAWEYTPAVSGNLAKVTDIGLLFVYDGTSIIAFKEGIVLEWSVQNIDIVH